MARDKTRDFRYIVISCIPNQSAAFWAGCKKLGDADSEAALCQEYYPRATVHILSTTPTRTLPPKPEVPRVPA